MVPGCFPLEGEADSSCEHQHPATGEVQRALTAGLDIGVKFSGRHCSLSHENLPTCLDSRDP